MKRFSMARVGFCLVVVLWLASATAFAADDGHKKLPPNWDTYFNDRFGQTVDYPKDVFPVQDPPPTNDDGGRFHSRDGKASFTASGSFNATDLRIGVKNDEDETLESFEETARTQDGWTVTYRKKGKDYVVLSGTKGDRIFYDKTMLVDNNQIMVNLTIEYPAAEKKVFDKIVPQMAASLQSDGGNEGSRTGSSGAN